MNRKEFVRNTGLAAASLAVPLGLFANNEEPKVRVGIIGVGLRGQNHLSLLLRRNDVEVTAICDISPRMLEAAKAIIAKSGKQQPKVYTGDNNIWRSMVASEKLDTVIIATPWEWHKPMIIGSLQAGLKYVGTEVVLGIT